MKLKLLLCFLIPFGLSSQNLDNKLNIKYESGIESLISKNEKIQKDNDGILGWRIQLTFKSTKEEIKKTRKEFIKLYPNIPSYLTYDSPYYRICVGNFRTKLEALRLKNFIRKNYIEAYPVKKTIERSLLEI
ncbi:MAG: SPOR domain-containing protein [Flavobacteriales bacterium]